MGIKLITPAATTPISISEAKEQSYITTTLDDTLIEQMIKSVTEQLQKYTGLQLVDATYEQTLDTWQDIITMLKNPVKSITKIEYYDEDDVLQTLDPNIYALDDYVLPNRLVRNEDTTLPDLKSKVNAIIITFIAGEDVVPEMLKSWLLIEFATLYENREEFIVGVSANELPNRYAIRLLDSFKVV